MAIKSDEQILEGGNSASTPSTKNNPSKRENLAPQVSRGLVHTVHGHAQRALEHVEEGERFVDQAAIAIADRMTPILNGQRFEDAFVGRLNENLQDNVADVGIGECDFRALEKVIKAVKKPQLQPVKVKFLSGV